MDTWHSQIQTVVDEIDACIARHEDEALTLTALSGKLGYSSFHTTRKFHEISGFTLREYLRLRRLAFALVEVRDTDRRFLSIAVDHGFSSNEAFTRAFRAVYGVTPSAYRKRPVPVVLRTKLHTFDRFILGKGEIGMVKATEGIKIYYVSIPAHKFLHIKNYQSDGYFDFWEKQDQFPGQDCDTICALLDGINGKLDSEDGVVGKYSGQIMARLFEEDGRSPEAYGVRLPLNYAGNVPEKMLLRDVPEGKYIVFEHGPFDYESECDSVMEKIDEAMRTFDFANAEYALDEAAGRVSYFYHDVERFAKRVRPVC